MEKARAEVQQMQADARKAELENVEQAISVYRQLSDELKAERDELKQQLNGLERQLNSLTAQNRKIIKLLDKITPENMSAILDEIKNSVKE